MIAVDSRNREIDCLRGIKINMCTENTETTASGIPVPCAEKQQGLGFDFSSFEIIVDCPYSVSDTLGGRRRGRGFD